MDQVISIAIWIATFALIELALAYGIKISWNVLAAHSCKSKMMYRDAISLALGVMTTAVSVVALIRLVF